MKGKMKISKEVKYLLGPKNLRKIAARESAFARMAEKRGDFEMAAECREVMTWALRKLGQWMKQD